MGRSKNDNGYSSMFRKRFKDDLSASKYSYALSSIAIDYYGRSDARNTDFYNGGYLYISFGNVEPGVKHYIDGIEDPNKKYYGAGNLNYGWLFESETLRNIPESRKEYLNNEYDVMDPVSKAYHGFWIDLKYADSLAIYKTDLLKQLQPVEV